MKNRIPEKIVVKFDASTGWGVFGQYGNTLNHVGFDFVDKLEAVRLAYYIALPCDLKLEVQEVK